MNKVYATETEIQSQPDIWREWGAALETTAPPVRDWIANRAPEEIWLCGAGTSAFIGDTLATSLNGHGAGPIIRAITTTDLVSVPHLYLPNSRRILVVSFGRSGNSSETLGALDLLDRLAPHFDWLQITCNAQSALAKRQHAGPGECKRFILPDVCHDAGFAMTSSFTTMLLTALTCLTQASASDTREAFTRLSNAAEKFLNIPIEIERPERAVFLGSGPLTGMARESALKVLELTAGQVVTSWDSTLGFRHGPKAVVNDATTVFVFLSVDPLTRRYDDDIAAEIRAQYPQTRVVTLGVALPDHATPDVVVNNAGNDTWNAPLFVLLAQRLSVAWSKSLDLNVDNPFAGQGNLTRVVANVRLYS